MKMIKSVALAALFSASASIASAATINAIGVTIYDTSGNVLRTCDGVNNDWVACKAVGASDGAGLGLNGLQTRWASQEFGSVEFTFGSFFTGDITITEVSPLRSLGSNEEAFSYSLTNSTDASATESGDLSNQDGTAVVLADGSTSANLRELTISTTGIFDTLTLTGMGGFGGFNGADIDSISAFAIVPAPAAVSFTTQRSASPNVVPLPASMGFLLAGLAGFGLMRRRG